MLVGCKSPDQQIRQARTHAFTVYWPPPENNKQIRVAVKDLIDIKGVVTTAGSEYIAKTAKPAHKDAKCREILRDRKMPL